MLITLTQFVVLLIPHTIYHRSPHPKTIFNFFVCVQFKVMQALNMAPVKNADYGMLFKKLKKELVESTLVSIDIKTKKDQPTYYSTDN
jgi:hypothetical protein